MQTQMLSDLNFFAGTIEDIVLKFFNVASITNLFRSLGFSLFLFRLQYFFISEGIRDEDSSLSVRS
jgi:hypothetical protein